MAIYAALADGNFSAAGTWGECPANTFQGSATFNTQNVDTTARDSAAFTPGAIEVNGIGIYFSGRVGTPTGTLTVTLRNSSDSVDVASVTVNQDQIRGRTWAIFPISAVTLTAGKNYVIRLQSSVSNQVSAFRGAATNDWHRFLRTTSGASIAAGDKILICGHLTGTGTGDDITVTMDNEADIRLGDLTLTTFAHSISVGLRGVLTFSTAASKSLLLKWIGEFHIGVGGTVKIGTESAPIPASSRVTLYADASVNGNTYILNRGSIETAGPQKTPWTNLTADAATNQKVLTVADTTGWEAGDRVWISGSTTACLHEIGTIDTVDSGTQITLLANLTNFHKGSDGYQSKVANLDRRIHIRGASDSLRGGYGTEGNLGDGPNTALRDVSFEFIGPAITWRRFDFGNAYGSAGSPASKHRMLRIVSYGSNYGFDVNNNSTDFEVKDSAILHVRECRLRGVAPKVEGCLFSRDTNNFGALLNILTIPVAVENSAFVGNTGDFSSLLFINVGNCPLSVFQNLEMLCDAKSAGFAYGSNCYPVGDAPAVNIKIWACPNGLNFSNAGVRRTDPLVFENLIVQATWGINATGKDIYVKVVGGIFGGTSAQPMTGIVWVGSADLGTDRYIYLEGIDCPSDSYHVLPQQTVLCSSTWGTSGFEVIARRVAAASLFPTAAGNLAVLASGINRMVFSQGKQEAGNHGTYTWPRGHSEADSSIYRGASGKSERLTPLSASLKLSSGRRFVLLAPGQSKTISVYVRKSVVGDGAAYNGNEPRLIALRHIEAGITADTVLATLSGSAGNWILLTASTPVNAYDNNAIPIIVDCDGTEGWINIDDWEVS